MPQKRQPSQSLAEPSASNHEARTLARAEQAGETLPEASCALVQDAFIRLRQTRHDITTNKGVVQFLNETLNAFIIDPEGSVIGRNELNTIGYVCGIQLRAIQAVQQEENPQTTLSDLLGATGQVTISMTREERKMFLTAGTPEGMMKIVQAVKNDGRVIEVEQQSDGTYEVPRMLKEPPRTDAKMPTSELTAALNASGVDVTQSHVRKLFGPSLGSTAGADAVQDEIEEFGLDELFSVKPSDTPGIAHDWKTVSKSHPNLPGAVVRVSECTRCGITTKDTNKHRNELCGSDIRVDK